jgi:two-component system OmpR family response regulator
VLVVDDDSRVRKMLDEYLSDQGVRVTLAKGGAEMWAALDRGPADVVLLDLVMPGEDGLTLASQLRARSDAGIIILTGRGDVVDRVVGLEVGADDYMAKPFHLREVLARIRSVARRKSTATGTATGNPDPGSESHLIFEGWRVEVGRRRVTDPDGKEVALTTGEFELLMAFAEHANRVLDRDTLMDLAKGRQWEAMDRSVDTQVARLRKKIEIDPKKPSLIRSVRGVGYLFAAEVKRR